MKLRKEYLTFVAACLFLAVLAPVSIAQWQPDVRLTYDTARSFSAASRQGLASNGSFVHIVWADYRNGEPEIYYKLSTNGCQSWSSDFRLTNAPGISDKPSIAVYGSTVHVVWQTNRNGNWDIYYKRSTNNGLNWSTPDIRLTGNGTEHTASLSAASYVHVVWMNETIWPPHIYYRRSTDGGINWGPEIQLTSNFVQKYPCLASLGSVVHVVFEDERAGASNTEIYYKRSSNGGLNWGSDIRLTNSAGQSYNPIIAPISSYVHVVWEDERAGNSEIYHKRSTDWGESWGSDLRLTNNSSPSYYASIFVSSLFAHITWIDNRDGHDEIYYKLSTNFGVNWGSDTRLTNYVSDKLSPSVNVSGYAVYVAWSDKRAGNFEIFYKRNPTGNPVGIDIISSEIPSEFKLCQNYPNPFNPVTNINFSIPERQNVALHVYDANGRIVETLINYELSAGYYEIDYDASELASGVYFYSVISGDFKETKKMILLK